MEYISHYQNAGKKHNLMIANKSFENVAQLKCLGQSATNENCIHEEIKSKLISGNAYYQSVQNLCLLISSLQT
jgi:hypothetical protein